MGDHYRQIDQTERRLIMHHREAGKSFRAIGLILGRSASTISREIDRNRRPWAYEAEHAQSQATKRKVKPRVPRKLHRYPRLREIVHQGLDQGFSPQQICGRLKRDYPEDPTMRIAHETIYAYIYAMPKGETRQAMIGKLRRKHKNRRSHNRVARSERGKIANMISIHDRPSEIEGRAIPGHWEGDLIVGKKNQSAVGTLVERQSRYLFLAHLESKKSDDTRLSFTRTFDAVPPMLRQSLTYDQGKEMSEHQQLAADLNIDVYFCDPHAPWQRGTNENTNGLVREYLPKGSDLSKYTQHDLNQIAERINNRPRKILDFQTPNEVYSQLLKQGVAL